MEKKARVWALKGERICFPLFNWQAVWHLNERKKVYSKHKLSAKFENKPPIQTIVYGYSRYFKHFFFCWKTILQKYLRAFGIDWKQRACMKKSLAWTRANYQENHFSMCISLLHTIQKSSNCWLYSDASSCQTKYHHFENWKWFENDRMNDLSTHTFSISSNFA